MIRSASPAPRCPQSRRSPVSIVAEAELRRRLEPLELHRFPTPRSTRPTGPTGSVGCRAATAHRGPDAMLIGGPPDPLRQGGRAGIRTRPDIHHPTGYWLMPASPCSADARSSGTRSRPGASAGLAAPLRTALENSSYVAVRLNTRAMTFCLSPTACRSRSFRIPASGSAHRRSDAPVGSLSQAAARLA